jgi:methionine-rich copper-binding protein CopC
MKFLKTLVLTISFLTVIDIGQVQAHSRLISTSPRKDSIVSDKTSKLVLTFNEDLLNIQGKKTNFITMTNPAGKTVTLNSLTVSHNVLRASLNPRRISSGVYVVSYRVVSADGHPIIGRFTFTVK